MKYQQFIFHHYEFDQRTKTLSLNYRLDDSLHFTETYRFDFEFGLYDTAVFDRAVQLLFFMVGVSYYKTYLPPEIVINKGKMTPQDANFFAKTYQRGLGEFFYINQLDPKTAIPLQPNTQVEKPLVLPRSNGILIGIGGGKDSLVSVELLRNQPKVATWSVGHRPQLTSQVKQMGLPHFWVERTWDRQLLELNKQGALNGHVPISAILASVGTVVAVLTGYRDVIVSNESSASEPNLTYQDVPINHQYSKSLEFEQDFQALLGRHFGTGVRYYSFLRPLSELRIAELFSAIGFEKYKDVFSSCNRAFTHDQNSLFWCGECPKCAFVFLILTPFIPKEKLEALFHGKNLLETPELEPTYEQLLGIKGDKPLECVGEVKESRTAMQLAQTQYLDLLKYHFEVPGNYDYRTLGPSSMPEDMLRFLISRL
jgi:UDP-N-acetyl-alpha-D-muramoyl-L-alanyl-L-glutamate epimerase